MKRKLALAVILVLAISMLASVSVFADEIKVLEAPVVGAPVPDGEPIVGDPVPDGEPVIGEPVPDGEPVIGAPVPDGEPVIGEPVPDNAELDIAPAPEEEEKIVISPAPVSRSTDGFAPMPEKELSVSDIFVAAFCLILLIITGIYFYIMYKREMEKEAAKKAEQPEQPEQQDEAKPEE